MAAVLHTPPRAVPGPLLPGDHWSLEPLFNGSVGRTAIGGDGGTTNRCDYDRSGWRCARRQL